MFLASEGRIVVYAVVCMELMEEAIMKVDILTREYPPHVYGGAGVHVEELAKVLAERIDVTVRAFDGPARIRGGAARRTRLVACDRL